MPISIPRLLIILTLALCARAADCFTPGAIWPDDKGVHINAHGGGVLFHDGRYYWFGEHKVAGEAGNQAQVVANQDEGHVVAGSQAVQQVEYLRLHGAIKRGGGFVCNQQIGFARQCAGYGYALALAA